MVRPPATKPKKVTQSCQMEEELAQALADEAERSRVPKSHVMREALRAYLGKRKGGE